MNRTEALSHIRWKVVLNHILDTINPTDYANKTFDEILLDIYRLFKPIKGLGRLAQYDVSAELSKMHGISISKVYIIGNGPKRAIRLLGIIPKVQKIGRLKLRYVDIIDVLQAFETNGHITPNEIKQNTNGDILESYLCNCKKTIQ